MPVLLSTSSRLELLDDRKTFPNGLRTSSMVGGEGPSCLLEVFTCARLQYFEVVPWRILLCLAPHSTPLVVIVQLPKGLFLVLDSQLSLV